jgi:hypothetical protein
MLFIGISIKRGGVNIVLWTETSLLGCGDTSVYHMPVMCNLTSCIVVQDSES